MKTTNHKINRDQRGIVSVMVAIIIMIVLALMLVAFARLVRREQRQVLDRQLSTQAFYAAESAVNDVKKAYETHPDLFHTDEDYYTNCDDFANAAAAAGLSLSSVVGEADDAVDYSCLLVDPSPPYLIYDEIRTDKSTIVNLELKGENPGDPQPSVNGVELRWVKKDVENPAFGSCPPMANPFLADWPASGCDAGVLRVDLVPVELTGGGAISRSFLQNNTFTGFFVPQAGGGGETTYQFADGRGNNQGLVGQARCQGGLCRVRITQMGHMRYMMRVKSIYSSSTLYVCAPRCMASSGPSGRKEIVNSQILVDATGRANDVLRRLQVRIPISGFGTDGIAEAALQSNETLCKRLALTPDTTPPAVINEC